MTQLSRRAFFRIAVGIFAAPACAQTRDGASVTEDDIEQRTRLDALMGHRHVTRDDVISELGDDRAGIRQAREAGIDVADATVEAAYAELCARMRITPEQLTKSLGAYGIRSDALKQRIRADMARISLARFRRMKS